MKLVVKVKYDKKNWTYVDMEKKSYLPTCFFLNTLYSMIVIIELKSTMLKCIFLLFQNRQLPIELYTQRRNTGLRKINRYPVKLPPNRKITPKKLPVSFRHVLLNE